MTLDDRLARVALSQLGEPGDLTMAAFIAELGAVDLFERLREGSGPDGMSQTVAARLNGMDPARDLEQAAGRGIRYVIPSDSEWPHDLDALDAANSLDHVGRAPIGLWVRGPARLDQLPRPVAMVGSRSGSAYGCDVALEMGRALADAGCCIVSGAAFGIDVHSHRGALAGGGQTVAVLACGVDRAYPASHRPLLDHLAHEGAIVSELAPGCAPMRQRFLSRNRVIAALATGTVVVEAAARSGAISTANWTTRLNRPLMAVPGPVTEATSQGTHELIRCGAATLVTSAADVLELVGPAGLFLTAAPRGRERSRDALSHTERQVVDALPVGIAARSRAIARTAGLGYDEVETTLLDLEAKGMAQREDEGWRLAARALD
jgi:DNA processing protein